MFDIGFTELVLIAVIALIVLGPERLPAAARTLGRVVRRVQGFIADTKDEFNRQLQAEDLKNLQDQLKDTQTIMQDTVSEVNRHAEDYFAVDQSSSASQSEAKKVRRQSKKQQKKSITQTKKKASAKKKKPKRVIRD